MIDEIEYPNSKVKRLQCPHCKHRDVYNAFLGIHGINCENCKDLFYYYFLDWDTPAESGPKYLVDAEQFVELKQELATAKDYIIALLQDK